MSDIIKVEDEPENITEIPNDLETKKLRLTFADLGVKWIINKSKTDKSIDYFDRIQFTRFQLERASGKRVKININRGNRHGKS